MRTLLDRNIGVSIIILVCLISGCATQTNSERAALECNILDYGARQEATLNTAQIQQAIDDCAGHDGRVTIPAGVFKTATLHLKSDMELHLAAGATLMGSATLTDYPSIVSRSGKSSWHLLYALDVQNVQISGEGTIDGQGELFWDKNFYQLGIPRPTLPRPSPWLFFDGCENVEVKNITMQRSPAHNLTFRECRDVVVDGVTVRNDFRSPNTDGIQVIASQNIEISQCTISTGDDGIVLIASADNVKVRDCYIESDDSALKLGIASNPGIKNTHFSNVEISKSQIGIAVFMKDGGVHANNVFENIKISTGSRHSRDYPIYVDVDRRRPDSKLGRIDNLVLRDIDITTDGNILIAGNSQSPITDLKLRDIRMRVNQPLIIKADAKKPIGDIRFKQGKRSDNYANLNGHIVLANIHDSSLDKVNLVSLDETKDSARPVIRLHAAQRLRIDRINANQRDDKYGQKTVSQTQSSEIDIKP